MKIALVLIMMALANTFMLTAWYWHLRPGSAEGRPLILIILSSWLIALLEYSIMVPANRLGASAHMSVAQLRVAAEARTVPARHALGVSVHSRRRLLRQPLQLLAGLSRHFRDH